jgi:uncharacterized protein
MIKRYVEKIKHHFREVIKLKTTPQTIALGFAIGTFISVLPTPGFNILLGLLIVLIFERVSKLSLFGAILFWNPITSIPIYWLNHKVGDLLFGSAPVVKYNIIFVDFVYNFSRRYLLGSVINGIIISALCYLIVWFIASKYYKSKKVDEIAKSIK